MERINKRSMLDNDDQGCEQRGILTSSSAVEDGANAPALTKVPTGPSEDNFAISIVFSAHLAKLRPLPFSYQLLQTQQEKELLTLGTNVFDQSIMSFSDKCGTLTRKLLHPEDVHDLPRPLGALSMCLQRCYKGVHGRTRSAHRRC